jgi:hypothetical protein
MPGARFDDWFATLLTVGPMVTKAALEKAERYSLLPIPRLT